MRFSLTKAHIHLDNIRKNYRFLNRAAINLAMKRALAAGPGEPFPGTLSENGGWPDLVPVVKADAYGHGQNTVALALLSEGAQAFASGSIGESADLRIALNSADVSASRPQILSLLGFLDKEEIRIAAEYAITPVVHSFRQLDLLAKANVPLSIAIKCNSGMSRLGFDDKDVPGVIAALKRVRRVRPSLAVSHLASADSEEGILEVRRQAQKFARMTSQLRREWPELALSLANSAGALLGEEVEELLGRHSMRPGLSLYGGNPMEGTSMSRLGEELLPAMSVSAPIIAVRELSPGEAIGYGHTFRATRRTPVGIVAVGYANAFPRSLSGRGEVAIRNGRAKILGRVSMQMTAVDLSGLDGVVPGEDAWLMGGPFENAVSASELAEAWGTIPYEVFCLMGLNSRVYHGE